MILCANPHAQYLSLKEEIDAVVQNVFGSGRYILGNEVQEFEKEFSAFVGAKHGIGVGSGTEALHLALVGCGIKQGDEVITVSHTAVATVSAIEMAGAVPIFVDVEADYYTIDPDELKKEINPRTKAVIVVHLYGQPANLSAIQAICSEHQLKLIEDCAQAHGTSFNGKHVGTFGDVGCFSFYPTKNLSALGDGGMVITNNDKIFEKITLLRQYGWKERYISEISGWNSRLDEVQAAVLRVKLKHLQRFNEKRSKIADYYRSIASDKIINPKVRSGCDHAWHLYVIRTAQRPELMERFKRHDIQTLIHYPVPVHLQPAYRNGVNRPLTQTEELCSQILSLPMYPELKKSDVDKVMSVLQGF